MKSDTEFDGGLDRGFITITMSQVVEADGAKMPRLDAIDEITRQF